MNPTSTATVAHTPEEGATAIRGLSVSVNNPGRQVVPLVQDVSLTVGAGRIVGVVGETGAGKTITMRAILGLAAPQLSVTGHLKLPDETEIDLADRRAVRALLGNRLAVVLQNPLGMLDPLFKVGDQLIKAYAAEGV